LNELCNGSYISLISEVTRILQKSNDNFEKQKTKVLFMSKGYRIKGKVIKEIYNEVVVKTT
jgi:hypothetical protein